MRATATANAAAEEVEADLVVFELDPTQSLSNARQYRVSPPVFVRPVILLVSKSKGEVKASVLIFLPVFFWLLRVLHRVSHKIMLEVMRRQRAQKSTDEENKAVVEAANFLDDTLEVFSLSNHHLLLRVKKAGVVVTRISYILDWTLSI